MWAQPEAKIFVFNPLFASGPGCCRLRFATASRLADARAKPRLPSRRPNIGGQASTSLAQNFGT